MMMENFFACFENSTSKIRRIVLCCRRKPLTPPFPFLVSETSKFEARVLKSQSIRKLRSSGFCFGSWVALRPLVCSWSILGPISRNQSAHSRTEPKLLSSTASEDDQETPLKHSLWTKSLTWTHPAPKHLLSDTTCPPSKTSHLRCNIFYLHYSACPMVQFC